MEKQRTKYRSFCFSFYLAFTPPHLFFFTAVVRKLSLFASVSPDIRFANIVPSISLIKKPLTEMEVITE